MCCSYEAGEGLRLTTGRTAGLSGTAGEQVRDKIGLQRRAAPACTPVTCTRSSWYRHLRAGC